MEEEKEEKIFSISEFISILNIGLKRSKAKIIGEVSEVSFGPTGHVYFTLKDEKDKSVINSIIWKSRYAVYGIKLKQGLKIIASGYPEIYASTGRLSFIAETIEYAGEGKLKKEYEKLKKKLKEEGIFEEARKKPIPQYVHKIGVITSMKGAVIADFSSNLKKFGFKVKIIDSRVEGQVAVADLLLSIKTFKKQDIDVLAIMRGGGSLESMQAFNNEALVKEVANFPAPVITGIGHHKDEPLIALAADKSVSTPTAVANIINEPWMQAIFFLREQERSIITNYESTLNEINEIIKEISNTIYNAGNLIVEEYKKIENQLKVSLQNFKNALLNKRIFLENSLKISFHSFKKALSSDGIFLKDSLKIFSSGFKYLLLRVNQKLEQADKIVSFNNPERQLKLGYSIASYRGKIIRTIKNVKIGEDLDIKIIDGIIISKVNNINKINK